MSGSGNSYDFGARMYDARLGKWFSVDPLAYKYVSISPFAFSLNSPIMFLDADGRIIKDANGNTIEVGGDAGGNAVFTVKDDKGNVINGGAPDAFTKEVLTAMFITQTGKDVIAVMQNNVKEAFRYESSDESGEGAFSDAITTKEDGRVTHILTIYEKEITPAETAGTTLEGASREEILNATGVHEPIHKTDPAQIKMDKVQSKAEKDKQSEYKKSGKSPAVQREQFEGPVLTKELQTRKEYHAKKGTVLSPAIIKKYTDVIKAPKTDATNPKYQPK